MKNIFQRIESYSRQIATDFVPYTRLIGVARSILALGTLLTLLLNPSYYFFNKSVEGVYFNTLLDVETFWYNKFNFFLILGPENAYWMQGMAILVLLSVISGYFMKLTSVLHWWVALSFMLSSSLLDGGDQIAAILSFLLIPICMTDPRRNHWHRKEKCEASPKSIVAIMSVWLIRLQLAVIYFDASVGKFPVEEWANGTAIYYWLHHSVFGITDFWEPILNPLLTHEIFGPVLTYSVMLLELCLFLALVGSVKYRKRLLPFALGFHFFIIIFHGIFSFFFSIAAGVILYLYPTYEELNFSWLAKWKERLQKRGPSTESMVEPIGGTT